jgi:hypothetical protein
MPQLSTKASLTLCRRCRRAILNGWDDGLIARVEVTPVDEAVAVAASEANGRPVYAFTPGGHLVQRMIERAGGQVQGTWHLAHAC